MNLFENQTYENLMTSVLSNVPVSMDTRESSLIYNAVAPTVAELAQLYIGLDFVFTASHLSTAPREHLIRLAKDRGIESKPASYAIFRAEFNIMVPVRARFSCDDLNFAVFGRLPEYDTEHSFCYELICDTAGSVANSYIGTLIPVSYIDGLTSARLVELLVPGEDEEDTETFRTRVIESIKFQPFGGNQADYKQKVLNIKGVSACKVCPVWNGDISPSSFIPSESVQSWFDSGMVGVDDSVIKDWITSIYNAALNKKLTVGGTVKIVIMGADNSAPSDFLIDEVQTIIDPNQNAGEGFGLAPIGHIVKVVGVIPTEIQINSIIEYAKGWDWASAKSYVKAAIEEYFDELIKEWDDVDSIVVRISHLESKILQKCSTMITDISGTALNGLCNNVYLAEDCIPVWGGMNE